MKRKQRNKFYKKMLKVACADPSVDYGFCRLMRDCANYEQLSLVNSFDFYSEFMKKHLPELFSFRPRPLPEELNGFWFPKTRGGWKIRIGILVQCKAKTKKSKPNEVRNS